MSLLVAGLCLILLLPAVAQQPQEEGVCARVRIQISQEVAITRTAFRATLEVMNAPENVSLQNVRVTLNIRTKDDTPSNDLFGIAPPALTNISDINGGGSIGPGVTAKAVWTIIPTRDAAPDVDKQYFVGGELAYIEDGKTITAPLFPASIWVKPDARLVLDYFLVRDVYSDDPFTAQVEPTEPFPLGLIMKNLGKGIANNVRITSSQPKIIDNEKGLLVDFKIIGAQVNRDPASPSLSVNLGNIGPGQTSTARWMMTCSLQGKFIEYKATFEHLDGLGDPRLSLIDSVTLHELTHAVRVDNPFDDNKPDFLVNDEPDENINPEHMPNRLYNSSGEVEPVSQGLLPQIDGAVGPGNLQVHLAATMPEGWAYIRTDDPGQEKYRLSRVVRSDGREILLGDNVWTTHRNIRLQGQAPYREHRLHLLDKGSTGSYLLIYQVVSTGQFSLGEVKQMTDGEQIDVGGTEGLAVTALLTDCIYVESLDRTCGIKVVGASAFEGDRISFTGELATGVNGERYLTASNVVKVGAGALRPLGMNLRSMNGAECVGGHGVSTVGLLVRTAGRVKSAGIDSFVLDDGSMPDGVNVIMPSGATIPQEGAFVSVTGIVSLAKDGSGPYPVLKVRRQADVTTDNVGPDISNLRIENIKSSSADVRWDTDGQSTSVVMFGTAPGVYTMTFDGPDFVTGHTVRLTGLAPNTHYYGVAKSKNYWNNITTTSSEIEFTTGAFMLPELILTFPGATRTDGTDEVVASARMENTAGDAADLKVVGIETYPSSVRVFTPASPGSPLVFGSGSLPGGTSAVQEMSFGTMNSQFYTRLTISYRDSIGTVRILTTPWKKVAL